MVTKNNPTSQGVGLFCLVLGFVFAHSPITCQNRQSKAPRSWQLLRTTGDKIDLLAEFTDTVNCSGFKYGIKRVYSIKDNGEYNSGKTPSDSDRTVILPKIELSARQSYDKIANILAQTLKADENG